MAGKKGMQHYSYEFQEEITNLYKQGLTYGEIQIKSGFLPLRLLEALSEGLEQRRMRVPYHKRSVGDLEKHLYPNSTKWS